MFCFLEFWKRGLFHKLPQSDILPAETYLRKVLLRHSSKRGNIICTRMAEEIVTMSGSLRELGQKGRVRKRTQPTTSTFVVDAEVQRLLKEHLACLRDLDSYRPT